MIDISPDTTNLLTVSLTSLAVVFIVQVSLNLLSNIIEHRLLD